MINDMTLVGEVMMKIVSGMLFNVEGAIVVGVFIVGAFVIKYKLEQNWYDIPNWITLDMYASQTN